jgi:hypothetical protein
MVPKKQHKTKILFGDRVWTWCKKHNMRPALGTTCVATCSCGWWFEAVHGESAEIQAAKHREGMR